MLSKWNLKLSVPSSFTDLPKRTACGDAFKFVDSVIFLVGLQNLRSQKAMEKIGDSVGERDPTAVGEAVFVY